MCADTMRLSVIHRTPHRTPHLTATAQPGYDPWPSHDDPPRKAPTDEDDPVTATQRRIQDLKVKGLVDDDRDVRDGSLV